MKIQASITIPYAVANYAEMRDRGFYYVDKTDYIPRLEAYKAPVFLRPRRFGKSLLVSIWRNIHRKPSHTGAQPVHDRPLRLLENGDGG